GRQPSNTPQKTGHDKNTIRAERRTLGPASADCFEPKDRSSRAARLTRLSQVCLKLVEIRRDCLLHIVPATHQNNISAYSHCYTTHQNSVSIVVRKPPVTMITATPHQNTIRADQEAY
ncbi:unnamed protein product, partial [Ectocarpus sp. 4 AP-2014]